MVLFLCECDNWQLKPANKNSLTMCHLSEKGKPVQKQLDIFSLKSTEQKLLRSRKQASGGENKEAWVHLWERMRENQWENVLWRMKRVQKSDSFEAFKFFRNQNYPDIKKTSSHLYSVVTFLLFQNIRFYFEK